MVMHTIQQPVLVLFLHPPPPSLKEGFRVKVMDVKDFVSIIRSDTGTGHDHYGSDSILGDYRHSFQPSLVSVKMTTNIPSQNSLQVHPRPGSHAALH